MVSFRGSFFGKTKLLRHFDDHCLQGSDATATSTFSTKWQKKFERFLK